VNSLLWRLIGEVAEPGLRRLTRNQVYGEPYRGFESLPLRQPLIVSEALSVTLLNASFEVFPILKTALCAGDVKEVFERLNLQSSLFWRHNVPITGAAAINE
jgi:hypothetical protein